MGIVALAAYLSLALFSVILVAGRAEPIVITTFGLAQNLAGFVELDARYGSHIAPMVLAFSVLVIAGYAIANRLMRTRGSDEEVQREPFAASRERMALTVVTAFMMASTIFHFVAGGVPIFSDNVEVARFDFSSSGLGGLPGRFYLIGMPLVILWLTAARIRDRKVIHEPVYIAAWVVFVGSRILGGFKGGLLEVLMVSLLAYTVAHGERMIAVVARARHLVLALVALTFAAFVALQYASVVLPSAGRTIPFLVDRYTVGSAAAGEYALTHKLPDPVHGSYAADEVVYFAREYAGVDLGAADRSIPLDKTISALIVGLPPDAPGFRAPVTVGAGVSLMVDVGFGWTLLIAPFVGFAYRLAVARARSARLSRRVVPLALILAFNVWLVNGGLVYLVVNYAVVALIVVLLQATARLMWSVTARSAAKLGSDDYVKSSIGLASSAPS